MNHIYCYELPLFTTFIFFSNKTWKLNFSDVINKSYAKRIIRVNMLRKTVADIIWIKVGYEDSRKYYKRPIFTRNWST